MKMRLLRGQNLPLKCCQSLELFIYTGKRFGSLHKFNTGSAGQRVATLLAVKVEGLQQKSVASAIIGGQSHIT